MILVVAFIALRPSCRGRGDDGRHADRDADASPPRPRRPTAGETATPTPSPTPRPTVDPGPGPDRQEVEKLALDKGETVRFQVRAPEDEEVHVHGYDITKDVKAGQTTKIAFKATIDGIFEIEFEHSAKQIAELRVDP